MSESIQAAPAAPATESPIIENTKNAAESQEATEETNENLSGATEDSAVEQKAAPAEKAKEAKRKLKLKVDGKEFEEDFDPSNEEELIKNLQLAKVAQKRMSEHAQLKKEIDTFLQALQNSPESVMRQMKLDPEEFAVKLLQKKLDEEQKSPEQKKQEALEKELTELREKVKKEEDNRKTSERKRLETEHHKNIETGMINALETSGLPNKPIVVKRIAEYMLNCLDNGVDVGPADIAGLVKKEMQEDIKEYVDALPDDALEAFLGKERLGSLRKKQVAAMKKVAETASAIKPTGNDVKSKEVNKAAEKSLSFNDFLKG